MAFNQAYNLGNTLIEKKYHQMLLSAPHYMPYNVSYIAGKKLDHQIIQNSRKFI
jgi:hypothetical protein